MWIRLLIEIINDEKSVVLVDPDMFSSGFPEEINTFKLLMILIPFAHCFHHRYCSH